MSLIFINQVDSSKYWFNYRHMSNVVSLYNEIQRLGISKEHIILMSGIGSACDARNICPGSLFNEKTETTFPTKSDIFSRNINIDFAGEAVTVDSLIALLTGRHSPGFGTSQRLKSTEESNVILFITGHGGDEFFKFQDFEEISSTLFAAAFDEMYLKKRFKNLLFIVDTCQAATLLSQVTTPALTAISSSVRDENSYAYVSNEDIGVSVIDRFSFSLFTFLKRLDWSAPNTTSKATGRKGNDAVSVRDLFSHFSPRFLKSTPAAFEGSGESGRGLVPSVGNLDLPLREYFRAAGSLDILEHQKSSTVVSNRARRAVKTFKVLHDGVVVGFDVQGEDTRETVGESNSIFQQHPDEDMAYIRDGKISSFMKGTREYNVAQIVFPLIISFHIVCIISTLISYYHFL
jgi:GPI-anchor transamidase subunit K